MNQSEIDKAIAWRDIWFADNSNPLDMDKGIILFARTLFPNDCYNEFSTVHLNTFRNLLQLFNPRYRFLQERQLQLILPRGFAKSTLTNLFFLGYIICFNGFKIKIPDWNLKEHCYYSSEVIEVEVEKSFVVLISETSAIAETWVTRVRGELSRNKWIKDVFGKMKDKSIEDDEGRWTKSAFTVIKDTLPVWQRGKNLTVVSKGSGMQLRGINIKGRPDLEIWDDLYSLNNTKTPEARYKVRYFAKAEAKDGIDPIKGCIASLGTIVHEDTIPVDNEKSNYWTTIKEVIMDKRLFEEVITNHCTINRDRGTFTYPDRWKCVELEKEGYSTKWSSRWTLEMLLATYGEHIENRTESMFWQEYFHIVIAEEDKEIKSGMMIVKDIELVEKEIGGVWYSFVRYKENDYEDKYIYHNVTLGLGVDSAISYKNTADNSALILIGKDYFNRIYIFENKSGKFAFSDEIKTEYRSEYSMKLCLDRSKIDRIGSADEMFRMVNGTHHKPLFVVETNSGGGELIRQVRTKMQNYGRQYSYVEVYQVRDKIERILDTLKPYYQSRSVIHNRGLEILQHELEYLSKTVNDDNADILACTVDKLRKPSFQIDYNTEAPVSKKYTPPAWLKVGSSSYNRAHPDWVIH